MKRMVCIKCQYPFCEGEQIVAKVLSVYHDVPGPGKNTFKYCIERPHAALTIEHLVCPVND